jgi:putative CocE/NonD family hydrolase
MQRFFDQHLPGLGIGLGNEARVHYYSVHAGKWCAGEDWPVFDSAALYLAGAEQLRTSLAPTEEEIHLAVDLTGTTGTRTKGAARGRRGADPLRRLGFAAGITRFRSPAFEVDTKLTGHAIAQLWMSSSFKDAAVYVSLSECEADGRVHYITEGMLRAVHRRRADPPPEYRTAWPYRDMARASARALEPGVPEELVFALLPMSWTLTARSTDAASA